MEIEITRSIETLKHQARPKTRKTYYSLEVHSSCNLSIHTGICQIERKIQGIASLVKRKSQSKKLILQRYHSRLDVVHRTQTVQN